MFVGNTAPKILKPRRRILFHTYPHTYIYYCITYFTSHFDCQIARLPYAFMAFFFRMPINWFGPSGASAFLEVLKESSRVKYFTLFLTYVGIKIQLALMCSLSPSASHHQAYLHPPTHLPSLQYLCFQRYSPYLPPHRLSILNPSHAQPK